MNSPSLSPSQPVPGTHTANDGQNTTGTSRRISGSRTLDLFVASFTGIFAPLFSSQLGINSGLSDYHRSLPPL